MKMCKQHNDNSYKVAAMKFSNLFPWCYHHNQTRLITAFNHESSADILMHVICLAIKIANN